MRQPQHDGPLHMGAAWPLNVCAVARSFRYRVTLAAHALWLLSMSHAFFMRDAWAKTEAPKIHVAIDAGHGGEQLGAKGVCGVLEKDVTLKIALVLAELIEATQTLSATMIRQSDVFMSLHTRALNAQKIHADVLVSIHANASSQASTSGTETFFAARRRAKRRTSPRIDDVLARENEGHLQGRLTPKDPLIWVLSGMQQDRMQQHSQALAIEVQAQLHQRVGRRGRGVLQAPFQLLLAAPMPAILAEVGFLTHEDECLSLASETGQEKVALALLAGILAYVGRA